MQQLGRSDLADSASLARSSVPSAGPSTGAEQAGAGVAAARWRRKPDDRLRRAVRRVLIALSFKSNKQRSRSVERQQQQQQQSQQLSSWQLISGTGLPQSSYWDPVCCSASYAVISVTS